MLKLFARQRQRAVIVVVLVEDIANVVLCQRLFFGFCESND